MNTDQKMKPQMSEEEIHLMEDLLLSFGSHVDVLEWGSGGSTVYFPNFLKENNVSYTWTSVEYNKKWHEKISELTKSDKSVNVVLFDVQNDELKQSDMPMNEYVDYPSTLRRKYNFILVDGRKRRRCVLEASKLLKKDGITILHDARRTFYHCAFKAYPDSKMLLWTGLWQGRMENPGVIRKVINYLGFWGFRAYVLFLRFKHVIKRIFRKFTK